MREPEPERDRTMGDRTEPAAAPPRGDGDDEWTAVTKRARPARAGAPAYTEARARGLEQSTGCRNLAATLRSRAFEAVAADGWEYAGVGRKGAMPPPELGVEHSALPVQENRWGDVVVLRRSRGRGAPGPAPALASR